ncbi:MAG: hypothetical protein KBA08_03555 [Firmicutes bacterium]|nr:hypothetical protein [Bacillota bacterium]
MAGVKAPAAPVKVWVKGKEPVEDNAAVKVRAAAEVRAAVKARAPAEVRVPAEGLLAHNI